MHLESDGLRGRETPAASPGKEIPAGSMNGVCISQKVIAGSGKKAYNETMMFGDCSEKENCAGNCFLIVFQFSEEWNS